jgi:hypothetical protein
MQRVHISPRLGSLPVTGVSRAQVEALATAMLKTKLSSKTVRNTLSFLHERGSRKGETEQTMIYGSWFARPGAGIRFLV